MEIRIEASDLPGRGPGGDVHVAVQRCDQPGELFGLTPGDAPSATWVLECRAAVTPDGVDLTGPYVQGRPGGRFVYLSWGRVDGAGGFTMFRRAKLMFDALDADVAGAALDAGRLVGRLGLTDGRGGPLCAAVRPPRIAWSAG